MDANGGMPWPARRWVATGTAVLVVVHLALSWRISGPSVVFDEAGYLGNARWIGGDHHWQMPYSPAYASAYPLVLAPIFAVLSDPDAQWRAALVVNALLLASVFPLLFVTMGRVFGIEPRRAATSAFVGAAVPAVLAAGISAIAENLVLPLVVGSVLAAAAMFDTHASWRTRVWFGPLVAALYFAHPRFTLLLPIALVLLVAAAWPDRDLAKVAGTNAAGLVVGALIARTVNTSVVASRWLAVQRPEGGWDEWEPLFTTRIGVRELVATAAGQGWYLTAGSFGLVVLGVALVALRAWRPVADRPADAQRFALGYLVVGSAAVFATSVLFFAQNQFRLDHYVYGRHNDSFTPLWTAVAVAFLLSSAAVRTKAAAWMATLVVLAASGAIVIHERDPLDFDTLVSPFAAPAIVRTLTLYPSDSFVVATVVAAIGTLVGVGLVAIGGLPTTRVRPAVVSATCLVVALLGWSVTAGVGISNGTRKFEEFQYVDWTAPATIERLGLTTIALDASAAESRSTLTYPFYLPDVDFSAYDSWIEDPPDPVSLALLTDPDRVAAGDRIAMLDQGGLYADAGAQEGLALWVAPGDEFDRLDRLGALLPVGFPAALPESAQAARLEIVDLPPQPVAVEPGGRIPLRVEVRHTGTGAPWPDLASYAYPGHVRIVALITPLDDDGLPGARSGGELPRWMLPGDEATAQVEVVAIDQFLGPLPAGRYEVELAIAQDGFDWVVPGGASASFTMAVG